MNHPKRRHLITGSACRGDEIIGLSEYYVFQHIRLRRALRRYILKTIMLLVQLCFASMVLGETLENHSKDVPQPQASESTSLPAQEEQNQGDLDFFDLSLEELGKLKVITIATGLPKALPKAPSVASVITAEEIEAMGATTLDEALERVPGLHVGITNTLLLPLYSFRGIHTQRNSQALMLMDGRPIRTMAAGSRPFFFHLPVAAISRIEIIRGPGSAVHGADAFSGVINIVTKNAGEIAGTHCGVRRGSFDTRNAWIQTGGNWGGIETAFTLEYFATDGDRDRVVSSDQQTIFDGLFGTSASLAPGRLATGFQIFNTNLELARGHWKMRLWHWHLEDAEMGSGVAEALDHEGRGDLELIQGDLEYLTPDLIENWELGARLNFHYSDGESRYDVFPPGTTLPIRSDGNLGNPAAGIVTFTDGYLGTPGVKDRIAAIEISALYHGWQNHNFRMAAGFEYQDEEPYESLNYGEGIIDGTVSPIDGTMTKATDQNIFRRPHSRSIWHGSLQDEWAFALNWELTAGVRLDYYSDFGETINPRAALVWTAHPDLTAKLLYGRAFRAPGFADQYVTNNPVINGNPDLEPETIRTLELAFNFKPTSSLCLDLSLFGYRAKDLIDQVPDADSTTTTAQNAMDQKGHGFELEMDWKTNDTLRFNGNFAWQRSKDEETDARIADAPAKQVYLGGQWVFRPKWLLSPELHWVGDRARAAGDPRPDVKDYTLVNLTLRRKEIFKHWDFALLAKNLFDKDAREPSDGTIPDDYPLAGRSIMAELRYHWQSKEN